MSTMTHSTLRFAAGRHSVLARGALVVFFWALAATIAIAAHASLDSMTTAGAVVVKIAAIVLVAWMYVRLTARNCTVDHALLVGITWLLLDIGAEIATTTYLGRGWFDLIGPPAKHAIRDVLLLTWTAAPALFARFPSPDVRS